MSPETRLPALYDALLAAGREALEIEEYEVAYHALSAALHCAQPLHDEQRLGAIAAVAAEQTVWLADHARQHTGGAYASSRDLVSLYSGLERVAESMLSTLRIRGSRPPQS